MDNSSSPSGERSQPFFLDSGNELRSLREGARIVPVLDLILRPLPWVHILSGENGESDDADVAGVSVLKIRVGAGDARKLKRGDLAFAFAEALDLKSFPGLDDVAPFGK